MDTLFRVTRVIAIGLGHFLFVVSFSGETTLHEGEWTGGYGMTDFGFDMTIYFAGDFDRITPPLIFLHGAQGVPISRMRANSVIRAFGLSGARICVGANLREAIDRWTGRSVS